MNRPHALPARSLTRRSLASLAGRLATGLAAAVLALAAGGCLFEPRDAEPPATGQQIDYLPRTAPANVWENCRLSLVNRDVTGWDNAIYETFQYIPDSDTRSAFPAVDWDNWGRAQEIAFITSLYNNVTAIAADLRDEEISTPEGSGNFAEWDIIYLVEVTDQTGSVTKYRGRATLQFELQGSYWYLTYWRDENGESDPDNPDVQLPTMGVLRANFAANA